MSGHSKSTSSRDQGQDVSSTPVPKHLSQTASEITYVTEQMGCRICGINDKPQFPDNLVEEEKEKQGEARIKEAEATEKEEKASEENPS